MADVTSLSGPASVVDSLIVVLVTDVPAVIMYILASLMLCCGGSG